MPTVPRYNLWSDDGDEPSPREGEPDRVPIATRHAEYDYSADDVPGGGDRWSTWDLPGPGERGPRWRKTARSSRSYVARHPEGF